uniref:RuvB-like helicase n=1 Tax=Dermatophagoides pteronyssinus TaxID=6956 RepID=A0A6P6YKJ9_DERPT|nr:ruvB-like helicase 1 [Dermatophagoides pteronyssinus]
MENESLRTLRTSKTDCRAFAHSHVKDLGVTGLSELDDSVICGLVGQKDCRLGLALLADLIKSKRFGGKGILLVGPPSSGKTALAVALKKQLGPLTPFCHISASELFSREIKKTEALMEYVRRSTGVRLREVKNVYEGELMSMALQESANPHGGLNKVVSAIVATLRASNGTLTLKLAPSLHSSFQREEISIGDVVYIQADAGVVKRLGRCESHANTSEVDLEDFVALPRGSVYSVSEQVHDVTLHDLDQANCQPNEQGDLAALVASLRAPKSGEATARLRLEVDRLVLRHEEQGRAEIFPGVLFIDESHALDVECFSFLNKLMESENCPTFVFATNRLEADLRVSQTELTGGAFEQCVFGMPPDFLDRLVVLRTSAMTLAEAVELMELRAREEALHFDDAAVQALAQLALSESVRRAFQLMAPAWVLAQHRASAEIQRVDVETAAALFCAGKSPCE